MGLNAGNGYAGTMHGRDRLGWGLGFCAALAVVGALAALGCGQSASGGGSGGNGSDSSGGGGGADHSGGSSSGGGNHSGGSSGSAGEALHPPATIDLQVCSSFGIVDSGGCSTCCRAAGFSNAGYPFKDKCACGSDVSKETTICASQLDSADSCTGCCGTAGYKLGIWASGAMCDCVIKQDATVCATATQNANSCPVCCLNHGYLSYDDPVPAGGCVCVE